VGLENRSPLTPLTDVISPYSCLGLSHRAQASDRLSAKSCFETFLQSPWKGLNTPLGRSSVARGSLLRDIGSGGRDIRPLVGLNVGSALDLDTLFNKSRDGSADDRFPMGVNIDLIPPAVFEVAVSRLKIFDVAKHPCFSRCCSYLRQRDVRVIIIR
jgi:hypothetical protein